MHSQAIHAASAIFFPTAFQSAISRLQQDRRERNLEVRESLSWPLQQSFFFLSRFSLVRVSNAILEVSRSLCEQKEEILLNR